MKLVNKLMKINILYCCNKEYSFGFSVSLISFLNLHKPNRHKYKIYVVFDLDITTPYKYLIKHIIEIYRFNYELIHINDLTTNEQLNSLQEEYGFNWLSSIYKSETPQDVINEYMPTLNKSAYYRIYGIKYILSNCNNNDKILYLDSDTLINNPIDSIIKHDQHILYARLDTLAPAIKKAQIINNLNQYFNSGVLYFNVNLTTLNHLIDNCLLIIHNSDKYKLHFQDQCALNIAFNDNFGELDHQFNYFVCPQNVRTNNTSICTIAHFLDRPKPWLDHYPNKDDEIYLEHIKYQKTAKKLYNINFYM